MLTNLLLRHVGLLSQNKTFINFHLPILGWLVTLCRKWIVLVFVMMLASMMPTNSVSAKGKPQPGASPGTYIFKDDYEDVPQIRIMTNEEWMRMTEGARKGNYSWDKEHWLEKGWMTPEGNYEFETRPSIAEVTSEAARNGSRSVKMSVPPAPEGYLMATRGMARYFRNDSIVNPGTYRVEAWFYVPSGSNLKAYLSFEDHLDWKESHHPNVVLDAENGNIGYYDEEYRTGYKILDKVSFACDTWFKLFLVFKTGQQQRYTVGYESPDLSVSMTFRINEVWTAANIWYVGIEAFNVYAGALNTDHVSEEIVYVDDFSAQLT